MLANPGHKWLRFANSIPCSVLQPVELTSGRTYVVMRDLIMRVIQLVLLVLRALEI